VAELQVAETIALRIDIQQFNTFGVAFKMYFDRERKKELLVIILYAFSDF